MDDATYMAYCYLRDSISQDEKSRDTSHASVEFCDADHKIFHGKTLHCSVG